MVFNSVIFIFCFLPIFLLIYYFVPARARNPVLFAGSLFFYAWGDPTYLVLMLFSSFFNYYMGKELGKITDEDPSRKRNLIFAVVINLLILGFFKYWGFLLDTVSGVTGLKLTYPQLALPIGLSFYTFKNLSYILDIYMGKTEPCKGFFPYAVYSTMFPHMTAGPIVRYTDISESISRRSINTTRLGAGAELFIKGLSKKVLLADNLSALYTTLQSSGTTSFVGTWLAIGAYTLELYFDFSGYSDMAIGLGQMLGFNFNKNFDYPYISTSVSEFWRCWHISLGSWFRDYIYIPLGGNRVSTGRHIRNILVVWALTGLWHGASWNFVFWGVYYGLLLLAEKFLLGRFLEKAPVWLRNLYTMFAVIIGWVFFSQTTPAAIGKMLGAMFGLGASCFADRASLYALKSGLILMIISVISCRPGLYQYFKRLARRNTYLAAVINAILFFLCIAYMIYSSYTPFMYQQF